MLTPSGLRELQEHRDMAAHQWLGLRQTVRGLEQQSQVGGDVGDWVCRSSLLSLYDVGGVRAVVFGPVAEFHVFAGEVGDVLFGDD